MGHCIIMHVPWSRHTTVNQEQSSGDLWSLGRMVKMLSIMSCLKFQLQRFIEYCMPCWILLRLSKICLLCLKGASNFGFFCNIQIKLRHLISSNYVLLGAKSCLLNQYCWLQFRAFSSTIFTSSSANSISVNLLEFPDIWSSCSDHSHQYSSFTRNFIGSSIIEWFFSNAVTAQFTQCLN